MAQEPQFPFLVDGTLTHGPPPVTGDSESFIELMDYKIISTLSNISEEDAEKIVEIDDCYDTKYPDYLSEYEWFMTAKESLQSLITSLGLNREVLILEKI